MKSKRNRKGAPEKFCRGCGEKLIKRKNWLRGNWRQGNHRCAECSNRLTVSNLKKSRPVSEWVGRLVKAARYRAAAKGLMFSLTTGDLAPFPVFCPLTGVRLRYAAVPGAGWTRDGASLDRVDNRRGYEPGNVWIISRRANILKRDATLDELKTIVANWELRS